MKKIILLAVALLTVASCRIDMKPDSELNYAGFWSSEDAVRANHTGIYSQFRGYASTFWLAGELRSDIWGGATIETPSNPTVIDNDITTTKVPFGGWADFYRMIHYTNDFLKNAPTVQFANAAEQDRMMAEVYGIRAFMYFQLLKMWGDVPIVTEPLTGVPDEVTRNKKREPKSAVAQQVKDDIEKSLQLFGSDNSLNGGKSVYWSKPATLALKGEVYLWTGELLGGGNGDFTTAKTALSQITGFSLVPKFEDIWGDNRDNNNEFIFAFDYQQDQAGNFINGVLTGRKNDVDDFYDKDGVSMRSKNFIINGGNRYGYSPKVLKMFEADPDDTRGPATYFITFADDNGGAGYGTFTGHEDRYRAAVSLKFLGDVIDGSRQSFNNYPIYRYADVLLMLAEAKNHLAEDPSNEINAIRKRAYGVNYPAHVFVNRDQDFNTRAILNESLREFLNEGKRWWYLMRAGGNYIFDEVPSLNQQPIQGNPKKLYLPITQGMIDFDPNNMTQTDGY